MIAKNERLLDRLLGWYMRETKRNNENKWDVCEYSQQRINGLKQDNKSERREKKYAVIVKGWKCKNDEWIAEGKSVKEYEWWSKYKNGNCVLEEM